jgi:hypothetical protein
MPGSSRLLFQDVGRISTRSSLLSKRACKSLPEKVKYFYLDKNNNNRHLDRCFIF